MQKCNNFNLKHWLLTASYFLWIYENWLAKLAKYLNMCALKKICSILKSIHNSAGSQWGKDQHDNCQFVLVLSRAVALNVRWNGECLVWGQCRWKINGSKWMNVCIVTVRHTHIHKGHCFLPSKTWETATAGQCGCGGPPESVHRTVCVKGWEREYGGGGVTCCLWTNDW